MMLDLLTYVSVNTKINILILSLEGREILIGNVEVKIQYENVNLLKPTGHVMHQRF